MARNPRRSPARGGESKTGLIIALVFTILLSIGLGVATYLGFSGQSALEAAKKKADKDALTEKKAAKRQELQTLLLKAAAGYAKQAKSADEKEQGDLDKLVILRGQYERKEQDFGGMSDKDKAEIDGVVADIKKDGADDVKKSLKQQIAALRTELDALKTDLDSQRTTAQKTKNDLDDEVKKLQDQLKQKDAALAKANEEIAEAKREKPKQVSDVEGRYAKAQQDIETLKRNGENLKKDLEDRDKSIQDLQAQVRAEIDKRKAKEAATVKLSSLEFQEPWGKILRLDRTGTMAYIDLGTADNVRPQLTFSVAGRGLDGKAKRERKGAIEVVRVVDRKLALAKVTQVTDNFNDPIVPGDFIFNPAWNPTQREHVAVAGIIDLNGDGGDSTAEFVRSLERQGIVVDAYFDAKDLSIRPKGTDGITTKTHYLVLGDQPKFGDAALLQQGDERVKRKEKQITMIGEMTTKAKDEGVNIIGYRDFMMMIGYPKRHQIASGSTPEAILGTKEREAEDKGPEAKKEDKAPAKKDDSP
jgi:hypothetical protein